MSSFDPACFDPACFDLARFDLGGATSHCAKSASAVRSIGDQLGINAARTVAFRGELIVVSERKCCLCYGNYPKFSYTRCMQQQPFQREDPDGDPVAGTWNVRWERPLAESRSSSHASIPPFEPAKYRVIRLEQEGALYGEANSSGAPEQNGWRSDLWPEPQPAAPKGQWWAGWLPDPKQRYEFRYWDGSAWTNHVASGGVTGFDLL
jgi:hypothetical protein